MKRIFIAAVLAALFVATPAAAHDESEAEVDGLEVEARPALADVGQLVVVEAEYEPCDEDEADDDADEAESGDDDEESDDDESDESDEDADEAESEDQDEDADDEADESCTVTLVAPVTLTIDFGDGSGAQDMTIVEEDDEGELEAVASHRYATEGRFDVLVTATGSDGGVVEAPVVVQVGAGEARLAGGDRLGTSTRISREGFPQDGSAGAVLLARSDGFADALAAAGLAALEDAPVLLTPSSTVPPTVLAEIKRALGGPGTVYVLGGEAAIGAEVVAALQAAGHDVTRIAGEDRVATAVQLAEFLLAAGIDIDEVVLAGAENFPDALAGAAFTASSEAPMLLTPAGMLDERVAALLDRLPRDVEVLVVGGDAAVGADVVSAVQAMGFEVERLAGSDRYVTSVEIAERAFVNPTAVVLATGRTFPDALSGAAFAASKGAPVLLVGGDLGDALRSYLEQHAATIDRVYVLGGEGAVPGAVIDAAVAAAR